MKAERVDGWFTELALLNQHQRAQVQDALHPTAGLDRIVALLAQIRAPHRRCPRCGDARCHRHSHSHANDLQRYRCCACGRTFNDLTGTPLARLRWALDDDRVSSVEKLLSIAVSLIHS